MRVAIMITGDPTEYTAMRYGDYGDLFIAMLKTSEDVMDKFDVARGQFPELDAYDALIVTGSSATAHEPSWWVQRTEQHLARAADSGRKILGVCFGHQMLANALGGRSERHPVGWECGLASLEGVNPLDRGLDRRLHGLRSLQIHRDHVAQVPPGGVCHARSSFTQVQVFTVGENVLGIQGHPEMNADIIRDLIESRVQSGMIESHQATAALNTLSEAWQRDTWVDLVQTFLRNSRWLHRS